MNNTYEIQDDGAIFFGGKKIGVKSAVGVDFVSPQARTKHAVGLSEWMNSLSSGEDGGGGGSLLPDLPGFSGEQMPEDNEEGGTPYEKPDEGSALPVDMMTEGEEEAGPPPRDELSMDYNAAWLRWDFDHLPEERFLVKWKPYAEGNPGNFTVFKTAAGLEFCYGL